MLLHALICTLANAAGAVELPAPDSSQGIGWLVVGLAALAVAGEKITGGIVNVRKLRGADPQADDRYATKDDLQAAKDRLTAVEVQGDALQRTIATELMAIHRVLGRMEGHLNMKDH